MTSPSTPASGTTGKAVELRIREIAETDVGSVIGLLTRGFRGSRRFRERGFERLRARSTPPGLPRYGYLLEADAELVGAILVISSARSVGGREVLFSNLSSWYVEPTYRSHATQLLRRALSSEQTTYLAISLAADVRKIYEAFRFKRYSDGQFLSVPALAANRVTGRTRILGLDKSHEWNIPDDERRLIERQASYGCLAFCCVTDGESRPFVFLPRIIRRIIPCAHLVYCRNVNDLLGVAGSVGRHLLRLGRPFVLVDSNGPIPGLPGKYFPEATPKYFKGSSAPVLGDLIETEATIFGIWSPAND